MKTAIIDNGIDIGTLSRYKNQTENLMVFGENVVSAEPPHDITHGGECARIFAGQTGTLPNVSICLNRDSTRKSNANDLVTALEWCADNDIGLISLSMGTTQFSDVPILRRAVKKLQNAGTVLVAASSNRRRITYPAVFRSCIGVCQTRSLAEGEITCMKNPFDGVDVVTYPVEGASNSYANAFIAGMICNALDNDSELVANADIFTVRHAIRIAGIRRWLSRISTKPLMDWQATYLREKIVSISELEPIIITCCGVDAKSSVTFLKQLQKIINADGYICAIILDKGISAPSEFRFSLKASGLSVSNTLDLVVSLCHPDVILHNLTELSYSSDVLIYGEIPLHSEALLAMKLKNTVPDDLWMRTKNLFENKD